MTIIVIRLRLTPLGPDTGSARGLRGGAFSDFVQYVRSARRHDYWPGLRNHDIGVRLLRIR